MLLGGLRCAPPNPGANHIVACVTYASPDERVRDAVESLLDQSHSDLTVLVAYRAVTTRRRDPLRNIGDRRLIRLRAGPSAGDGSVSAVAAALSALDGPLVLVHGADDWSDPDRAAILLEALREEHAVAALSAFRVVITVDAVERHRTVSRPRALSSPLTPELREHGPACGLFTRSALERVGTPALGSHPGWDRLFLHFVLMTGHVAYVDEPLYTRRHEATSAPAAGRTLSSAQSRRSTALELERLYAAAFGDYLDYLAGSISEEELANTVQARVSQVGPGLRAHSGRRRRAA